MFNRDLGQPGIGFQEALIPFMLELTLIGIPSACLSPRLVGKFNQVLNSLYRIRRDIPVNEPSLSTTSLYHDDETAWLERTISTRNRFFVKLIALKVRHRTPVNYCWKMENIIEGE
jgi:hypothetical protein